MANNAYFPVLIDREFPFSRDALYELLKGDGIYARRYFYPLISEFPVYRGFASAAPANLPVATQVSRQVLCLPIFPDLTVEDQDRVVHAIRSVARQRVERPAVEVPVVPDFGRRELGVGVQAVVPATSISAAA